jgi:hypothetical protein
MSMIAWIRDTFFPTDDIEQLLDANIRMQAQMKARQAAYDSEIAFYHLEIGRLHKEIGELVKGMEIRQLVRVNEVMG